MGKFWASSRPRPLPHHHRRPKWCRDDGQSIKTFDRSHYEFRLILHRRLITHMHTSPGTSPIHIHLHARAYAFRGKGPWHGGRFRQWQMMPSPKMEPFHAITKGRREGWKEGVIDYGNIFSVEAKVKQHTSRRPSPRGPSNCHLWRSRQRRFQLFWPSSRSLFHWSS